VEHIVEQVETRAQLIEKEALEAVED
jgi:hypothetical protein